MKIPTNFALFNEKYDRVWKAVRTGLSAAEAGFQVTKQGEYLNQAAMMRPQGGQFDHQHFDQDQKGKGHRPQSPRPRPKQRDDLEINLTPSFKKPRPF
jgi:hypothetical protein